MKKTKAAGSVILIEHSGKPTIWPVQKTGDDDSARLLEVFETAKMMCTYELAQGGTLKLLDSDGGLVAEHRGRVA
jgi:hypothetical protein